MRYENPPFQGLSEARRGKKVSVFFSHSNRRGGVPSGAAAFIAILKRWTSLLNIQIYPFFTGNAHYQGERQERSFTL